MTLDIEEFMKFIVCFKQMGHDIDHRDDKGQTALHVAFEFRNVNAIDGLLACGADINVLKEGDRALDIIKEQIEAPLVIVNKTMPKIFHAHIFKLNMCGIYVSERNLEFYQQIHRKFPFNINSLQSACENEITLSKNVTFGPYSIRLFDFLSESRVIADYPTLPSTKRLAISEFFENNMVTMIDSFPYTLGVAKLQYRKAVARLEMHESAQTALSIATNLALPDPCTEEILCRLSNFDIINLTTAYDTL